jgi:hypothetical protein
VWTGDSVAAWGGGYFNGLATDNVLRLYRPEGTHFGNGK